MATPESRTKTQIKRILADAGVYYFMPSANGYGRAGIPDFVCCVNGRFLAIEAKAGKGMPTALQAREHERIEQAGGIALVLWESVEYGNHLRNTIEMMKG